MAETKTQDAIALLKEDHDKVQKLFKEFESAKGDGRKQKLAQQIALELSVHFEIEEKIFYPTIEGKVEEDLIKEAYVEHDGAKVLVADIQGGDGKSDDFFDAKVQVLSEEVDHHIKEEEGELFPQVRKADIDLKALGEKLAERKKALMAEYKADGVPTPELTTLNDVDVS